MTVPTAMASHEAASCREEGEMRFAAGTLEGRGTGRRIERLHAARGFSAAGPAQQKWVRHSAADTTKPVDSGPGWPKFQDLVAEFWSTRRTSCRL